MIDGKYIIYGAGDYGRRIIEYIGKENIEFYIDENENKQQAGYLGYKVYSLSEAIHILNGRPIVIAINEEETCQIQSELKKYNIYNAYTFREIQILKIKERIGREVNYKEAYRKALKWIENNSIPNEGIINNTLLCKSYPEVTGYYIPTLLRWNYRDLAVVYAKWLCTIQHNDGAWYDTYDTEPYIFDTAQILKGLIAIRNLLPEVDSYIIKGCDWLLSNMNEEGRLAYKLNNDLWGDGKTYSELIHTYCISPIYEAGVIFNREDYIKKADKIKNYYTSNFKEEILNFNLLSHFYAYVIEAMIDIGRNDLAEQAMRNMENFQKSSGAVPAYNDVDWVCSTGMFQLSLIWYRLGNIERGDMAFQYACKLQNETGGWFGSYLSENNKNENNTYFPSQEISWANKYFLDALFYRNELQIK